MRNKNSIQATEQHISSPGRKKTEFSKAWLIGCVVISCVYTSMSYALACFDKNAVETLSTTIIETMWGTTGISFAGYAIQNCVRAFTASKFGLPTKHTEKENNNEQD